MSKIDPRIVVTGYLVLATEDREPFIKLVQPHMQRTREKDGCLAYAFSADVLEPGMIRLSEAWRDLKSLEAHLADDEFRGVMMEVAKFRILGRSVQRYGVSSTTDI
jgi:quinol monooxygenase YgiN